MPEFDWKAFLEAWSKAVLSSDDLPLFNLPPSVIDSGWLGYAGAMEAEIKAAEKRLDKTLPPSYREFLKVSNGWRQTGHFINDLWPVNRINWHRILNPQNVRIWQEGDLELDDFPWEQRGGYRISEVADFKPLARTLQISDWGDEEILLLNPDAVSAEGEWEAWFLAGWIPGAYRFPSFRELTQYLYAGLLEFSAHQNQRVKSSEELIDKLPNLLAELQFKADAFPRGDLDAIASAYGEGLRAGMAEAQQRIRTLQPAHSDPAELRRQLLRLADEFDRKARTFPTGMGSLIGVLFNFHMGKMTEKIGEGGKIEGYRQAAGIIRWFLGEL